MGVCNRQLDVQRAKRPIILFVKSRRPTERVKEDKMHYFRQLLDFQHGVSRWMNSKNRIRDDSRSRMASGWTLWGAL